jgi:UDP-glucose 4-epimerase
MAPDASRVLLIGGMGFLGRHLARSCLAAGMTVRVADVASPAADSVELGVEYLQGDYCDPLFLRQIVEGADRVVHLVHDAMLLNLDCNMDIEFERNIRPAMRLMDLCSSLGVAKMVFLSSGGTVYGNRLSSQAITEDGVVHPISVYGTSKLMIEHIGFLYHAQKNLPLVAARPSNAYGPGQQPFRGQGFVATAFASALEGRPLTVFGDGSVVRDYIHIRDLADAIVALLRFGRSGEAYNIGNGRGLSLRTLLDDYITPILAADGYALDCQSAPARGVDVAYNVLANDKLLRDTGFRPRIGLEDGLRETWAWLKDIYHRTNTKNQ